MVGPQRQRGALQIIFAFFLGLMVTAFLGIGVYTFYPEPAEVDALEERANDLRREQGEFRSVRSDGELTAEQRERVDALEREIEQVYEERQQRSAAWARTTSIILVLLSTLAMGVSLIRADQLPVISNGLLLGGVFTMLYGTGWTIAAGESVLRFWVIAFALAVTLALGYVRFVRGHESQPAAPTQASPQLAELAQRIEELERRLQRASDSLGGDED